MQPGDDTSAYLGSLRRLTVLIDDGLHTGVPSAVRAMFAHSLKPRMLPGRIIHPQDTYRQATLCHRNSYRHVSTCHCGLHMASGPRSTCSCNESGGVVFSSDDGFLRTI